jgi:transposase
MRPPRRCLTSGGIGCSAARGGKAALATSRDKPSREVAELAALKKKVSQLERALGRKTYELEIAGELLRDWK